MQIDLSAFWTDLRQLVGIGDRPHCPECGCPTEHVVTASGGYWVCRAVDCNCMAPT